MSNQSQPQDTVLPPIVEDLFLTEAFLIKGRIAHKYQRLNKMLESTERAFITIEDATMVALRGTQVIRTPRVQINRDEIIFAHELFNTASDETLRRWGDDEKPIRIRAFYSGGVQIELAGQIEPGAYEPAHNAGRDYFVMKSPSIRGLPTQENEELKVLESLEYCIVRKSKLAYIYDFS